jgi:hypothetical protein
LGLATGKVSRMAGSPDPVSSRLLERSSTDHRKRPSRCALRSDDTTRAPRLPVALWRPDGLSSCRTLFADEGLSPSARERVRPSRRSDPACRGWCLMGRCSRSTALRAGLIISTTRRDHKIGYKSPGGAGASVRADRTGSRRLDRPIRRSPAGSRASAKGATMSEPTGPGERPGGAERPSRPFPVVDSSGPGAWISACS